MGWRFTAICLQLGVAKEELSSKEGDPFCRIQRAVELANLGLAEARRCAHYEGHVDWTDAGQVPDLIKAVWEAALQKLRRCDYCRLAA